MKHQSLEQRRVKHQSLEQSRTMQGEWVAYAPQNPKFPEWFQ